MSACVNVFVCLRACLCKLSSDRRSPLRTERSEWVGDTERYSVSTRSVGIIGENLRPMFEKDENVCKICLLRSLKCFSDRNENF